MADDLTQRHGQDRTRINMNEPWEVKYWTKELGVTQEELARAVRVAGNSVDKVRQQLKH
jgi:predicted transcriptional regulator